nr:hypothetical protein [Bradyrhizobium sp. 2S1]
MVAHFFRRAFALLREGGAFGLIATNTIGQGDTRETGLATILRNGGRIFRTTKRYQWPNEGAAVVVSIVHASKSMSGTSAILNGRQVTRISAYLVSGDLDDAPERLAANAKKAFIGSYVLGAGFTFDDGAAAKAECENLKTMRMLITKEPRNADRIFPYIGGEEVNTSPTHAHNRYVISLSDLPLRRDNSSTSWFMDEGTVACNQRRQECLQNGIVPADYPDEVAADWPDLLAVVERWVKPQRIALPSTNPSYS